MECDGHHHHHPIMARAEQDHHQNHGPEGETETVEGATAVARATEGQRTRNEKKICFTLK